MFCDLKRHGLNEPKLVVANGALGAWAALRDVSPRHHIVADVVDGVSLKDGIRDRREGCCLAHLTAVNQSTRF